MTLMDTKAGVSDVNDALSVVTKEVASKASIVDLQAVSAEHLSSQVRELNVVQ